MFGKAIYRNETKTVKRCIWIFLRCLSLLSAANERDNVNKWKIYILSLMIRKGMQTSAIEGVPGLLSSVMSGW